MTTHPNAAAAGLTGAITVLVVWALSLAGVEMPTAAASALTTILTAVVLFVGSRAKRRARATSPDRGGTAAPPDQPST